jgi:hypothetical protein
MNTIACATNRIRVWNLAALLVFGATCAACATPQPVRDLASQGAATVGLTQVALRNYLAVTGAQLGARIDLVRQDEQRLVSDKSRAAFDQLLDESASLPSNDQTVKLVRGLGDDRRKLRDKEAVELQKVAEATTFDLETLPQVPSEKLDDAKKKFGVLAEELSAKEWIALTAQYAGEISAGIRKLHPDGEAKQ